jgi:hypothetical protein
VASTGAVTAGLLLLREFRSMGMADAGRHLAALLASYAGGMSDAHLCHLIQLMAEQGLKQELPALVAGVGLGAEGGQREAAGLLAALLSGHAGLAADVVGGGAGSGGNAALATAYGLARARDGGRQGGAGGQTEVEEAQAVQMWAAALKGPALRRAPAGLQQQVASGVLPVLTALTLEA